MWIRLPRKQSQFRRGVSSLHASNSVGAGFKPAPTVTANVLRRHGGQAACQNKANFRRPRRTRSGWAAKGSEVGQTGVVGTWWQCPHPPGERSCRGWTLSCQAKRCGVETSGCEPGVSSIRGQISPLRPSASGRDDKDKTPACGWNRSVEGGIKIRQRMPTARIPACNWACVRRTGSLAYGYREPDMVGLCDRVVPASCHRRYGPCTASWQEFSIVAARAQTAGRRIPCNACC